MKKLFCSVALVSFAALANVSVQAEGLDAKRFYVGGGLNTNSAPAVGSARGFQFFGGYNFNFIINEDISTALEVGFLDSGDFDRINSSGNFGDATGVWASLVESIPLSRKTDMLVRLGYDFGDDDGFILGTGLQYKFDTKSAFRMEYVAREHFDSLQANVLFKF